MHWGALPAESARALMTGIDVVCWFTCWPCQLYSCSHSTNTLGCTCNCLQNAEHAVHWSTARVKNEWRSFDQTLTVMTTSVVRGLDGRTQATCPVGCIACVACVSYLSVCRVCLRNHVLMALHMSQVMINPCIWELGRNKEVTERQLPAQKLPRFDWHLISHI